jgi:hypothetical protein
VVYSMKNRNDRCKAKIMTKECNGDKYVWRITNLVEALYEKISGTLFWDLIMQHPSTTHLKKDYHNTFTKE